WKGWAILLRQKQKKLIMLPSETMIWQPEFTDKTLSRKPGAVQAEEIRFFLMSAITCLTIKHYERVLMSPWDNS
ncbi:hypothetical protein, partial [Escherichia coli]|uniref:hypothetical protein n=1 Tax=Escherichia coli TaxID=562 RepID=UPI001BC87864